MRLEVMRSGGVKGLRSGGGCQEESSVEIPNLKQQITNKFKILKINHQNDPLFGSLNLGDSNLFVFCDLLFGASFSSPGLHLVH